MRTILFALALVLSTANYACSCSPPGKYEVALSKEIEYSDNVIIGEILEISDNQKVITLKVKEIFKGELKQGQIITFKNNYYCEPFVDELGDWLIYSRMLDGEFSINPCGLSRSLKNPIKNRYFSVIPPPAPQHPDSLLSKSELELWASELKAEQLPKAIKQTELEIEFLRGLEK